MLLLSRQETKYKATAFWLAECINSGTSCTESIVSLVVDQTCTECPDGLGTLIAGGLHPQQLRGDIVDKPYLFSEPSQALHACHTLPPNDGWRIWTLTKIAWAEHLWSLANTSYVHMSTQILLYSSHSLVGMYVICYLWLWLVHHKWILDRKHVPLLQHTWH